MSPYTPLPIYYLITPDELSMMITMSDEQKRKELAVHVISKWASRAPIDWRKK